MLYFITLQCCLKDSDSASKKQNNMWPVEPITNPSPPPIASATKSQPTSHPYISCIKHYTKSQINSRRHQRIMSIRVGIFRRCKVEIIMFLSNHRNYDQKKRLGITVWMEVYAIQSVHLCPTESSSLGDWLPSVHLWWTPEPNSRNIKS